MSSELQIDVVQLVPGEPLLGHLLEEGIGVKLLDIEDAMTTPEALEEHDRAGGRGDTGGVAHALGAGLLVGLSMVGIIVNVVGVLLAATQPADAAANGGLTGVVAPELLGVGEDRLEELQGDDVDFAWPILKVELVRKSGPVTSTRSTDENFSAD